MENFHGEVVLSLLKSSKKVRKMVENILKESKIQQLKSTLRLK